MINEILETSDAHVAAHIGPQRNLSAVAKPQPPPEKYVRFRLSKQAFCLRAETVRGVMGAQSLIPALNSGFDMVGFIFSQNKALAVLDLRPKLNLHPGEVSAKGTIILVSLPSDPQIKAGILVEQLEATVEFGPTAVINEPHPQIPLQFLRGKVQLEDETVWVLDLDFLLNPVHLRRLETLSY